MRGIWEELLGYFESGGIVMPPLAIATVVLWYALGYRMMALVRGSSRSSRILIEKYAEGYKREPRGVVDGGVVRALNVMFDNPQVKNLRPILDDVLGGFDNDLVRGRALIRSIVSVAPLAGLLGTVIGMIETFDSLGDMTLFSQSGGIAGGISQALFTTQMGLAVAVPGIVMGRILDRKQQTCEHELQLIKDILCHESPRLIGVHRARTSAP